MDQPGVACTNCGKNMTTDDLRRTACVHCGQVLAHHARAAQQVAVINQMMVDRNGNGIPDAFEGLAANATRNAYAQMPFGGPGPMMGGPMMGGPMMGGPMMNNPYAAAHINAMNQGVKTAAISMAVVAVIIAVVIGLLVVGGAVAFFMVAG